MAFKETQPDFKMIDVALIEPDPAHPRKHFDETSLQGLANSIRHQGLIQPLVVQPANGSGRYRLIVGERRWRAAVLAGESVVPALVRPCEAAEALEIRVFENLGLGLRAPLETREMANAIQAISHRFDSRDAAAEHFGRPASWLNQVTAAANLSPKVSALLDAGQITSAATAVQLDKLAQKNEARAETLIGQIKDGEKIPKKVVDAALAEATGRRKTRTEAPAEDDDATATEPPTPAPAAAPEPAAALEASPPVAPAAVAATAPAEPASPADLPVPALAATDAPAPGRRVNPHKVRQVARLLGVSEGDEEAVLACLIDEFLASRGAA